MPNSGTYNILIAGGSDEDRRKLSTVEILGDSTCSIPNLPYGISNRPQMFLNVNQDGKKEVVICGSNSNGTSCLKLVNGSWKSFSNLKNERNYGHVAVSMAHCLGCLAWRKKMCLSRDCYRSQFFAKTE